jgi:hypothetical protein
MPGLQSVGAAAVGQVADINKCMYTYKYQCVMAPLVIYFTYLEGRDVEMVVKDLGVANFMSNRFSSYVFKRPYACLC